MTTTKALSIITLALCCATPALAQQQEIRLEWSKNLTEYRGQNGRRLTHVCPPQGRLMAVTGTDTYTDDSGVCSAAVHAGLITLADGGVVTIVIGPGKSTYTGSTRNGVTSQRFGSWWGSFTFDSSAAEGRIDWRTRGAGLELAGRPLTVVCPPDGKNETVWGTDTYTADSPICVAAVHAGLITFAGGRVTVEEAGAQKSYAASERNGVQSRDYGSMPTAFRFSGAGGAATASAESAPQPAVTTAPTPVTTTVTSTAPRQTTTMVAAPTVGATVAPTGTTAATTTVARAPATQTTGRETLAAAGPPPAPTGVRAEILNYRGTVMVHWDSMPGATSYDLLQRLPNGTWAGAAPEGQPYGPERSLGITMQLAAMPASLAVVANYGPGEASVPSAPVSVTIPRWYGRYRVSILGFKVERETADDPLETDGKRDEVYMRMAVAERGPEGDLIGPVVERRTLVHGDINLTEWRDQNSPNRRIKAGSASTDGGLRTGDAFPTATPERRSTSSNYTNTFPLLVWEGDLIQGHNTVQVAFNLWEADQRPGQTMPAYGYSLEAAALEQAKVAAMRIDATVAGKVIASVTNNPALAPALASLLGMSSSYSSAAARAQSMMVSKVLPRLPVFGTAATRLDRMAFQTGATAKALNLGNALVDRQTAMANGVNDYFTAVGANLVMMLNAKDRPLGIGKDSHGVLVTLPNLLNLSFESAEGEALAGNGPNGIAPGIYAYRVEDGVTGLGGNGIYIVYLQVERIQ